MTGPALHIRLATEGGKRVGRTSKAKRLAASPSAEAARLRRCVSRIKEEAERVQARNERVETLLQKLFKVTCDGDIDIARAMAREVLIDVPHCMSANAVVRYCEMAEDGTLCA